MLLFHRTAHRVSWDWEETGHQWIRPDHVGAYVEYARSGGADWAAIATDLQVPAFVARCWLVEDTVRDRFNLHRLVLCAARVRQSKTRQARPVVAE